MTEMTEVDSMELLMQLRKSSLSDPKVVVDAASNLMKHADGCRLQGGHEQLEKALCMYQVVESSLASSLRSSNDSILYKRELCRYNFGMAMVLAAMQHYRCAEHYAVYAADLQAELGSTELEDRGQIVGIIVGLVREVYLPNARDIFRAWNALSVCVTCMTQGTIDSSLMDHLSLGTAPAIVTDEAAENTCRALTDKAFLNTLIHASGKDNLSGYLKALVEVLELMSQVLEHLGMHLLAVNVYRFFTDAVDGALIDMGPTVGAQIPNHIVESFEPIRLGCVRRALWYCSEMPTAPGCEDLLNVALTQLNILKTGCGFRIASELWGDWHRLQGNWHVALCLYAACFRSYSDGFQLLEGLDSQRLAGKMRSLVPEDAELQQQLRERLDGAVLDSFLELPVVEFLQAEKILKEDLSVDFDGQLRECIKTCQAFSDWRPATTPVVQAAELPAAAATAPAPAASTSLHQRKYTIMAAVVLMLSLILVLSFPASLKSSLLPPLWTPSAKSATPPTPTPIAPENIPSPRSAAPAANVSDFSPRAVEAGPLDAPSPGEESVSPVEAVSAFFVERWRESLATLAASVLTLSLVLSNLFAATLKPTTVTGNPISLCVERERRSIAGLRSFLRRNCSIVSSNADEIVAALLAKKGVFSEGMLISLVANTWYWVKIATLRAIVGKDHVARLIYDAARKEPLPVAEPVSILEDEKQILRTLGQGWQLDDRDFADLVDLYVAMLNNVPMLSCVAICLCEHIFHSVNTVCVGTITSLWKSAPPLDDPTAVYELRLGGQVHKSVVLEAWSSLIASFQVAASSQNATGTNYKNANDFSHAVALFAKAATRGYAAAQFNLGLCYFNGQGVAQDYTKAVEWYTKAAKQGNSDAQCNLGLWYFKGQGVAQDHAKAVEWFTKAAEQGRAVAQYVLGVCFKNGQGVTQDYAKAVEWFTKAAEQGLAAAQCSLGVCYKNGQGVAKDYAKAVEWFTKAAEQGHAAAQNIRGLCYDKGQGVAQDYAKAVAWYAKAAEQGYAAAQNIRGLCYDKGQGVAQDYAKAAAWYAKAAEQGHAAAQYNLGLCYKNGQGVARDTQKAKEFFARAAAQGDVDAVKQLREL